MSYIDKNREILEHLKQKLKTINVVIPIDTYKRVMLNNLLDEAVFDKFEKELSEQYSVARVELFIQTVGDAVFLNPVAYGKIISILECEIWIREKLIVNWRITHPRIQKSSKDLFENGHYSNAAEDAFIEINDRAKEIYRKNVGETPDIPDGVDLMNKLFSDRNPIVKIGGLESAMVTNLRQGYQAMFRGAMSALRNPKAHSNCFLITAEEAARRIMFASMLMYVLDDLEKEDLSTKNRYTSI